MNNDELGGLKIAVMLLMMWCLTLTLVMAFQNKKVEKRIDKLEMECKP